MNQKQKYKKSETTIKKELDFFCENSEEQAKNLVDHVQQPAFILNIDDRLSVYYANMEFYDVFSTDETTFYQLYQNRFSYTFTFDHQLQQLKKIHEFIARKNNYQSSTEIITSMGDVKEISFDIILKKIDKAGEKLFGFISPMAKEEDRKLCFP